jgi:hypothetical protein
VILEKNRTYSFRGSVANPNGNLTRFSNAKKMVQKQTKKDKIMKTIFYDLNVFSGGRRLTDIQKEKLILPCLIS